jgi:SRSO17 transposase
VLVVDETGFLKKGIRSAGVERQYSGTAGPIENCQIGVFLAYTTTQGSTLIDRVLYLPQEWLSNPAHCQQADIPDSNQTATGLGYDWACVPINHMLGSGWQCYFLIRRSIEKLQEVAFYRVFYKADTSLPEMVHVAGQHWSVEQCFQLAKGETGLDQYEVRKWKGWYRHITLSMLALAFLAVQRARKKELQTDELIPLSMPEIRRLLAHRLFRQVVPWSLIQHWFHWRRRHQ